ncbi:hypothetical protein FRB94_008505 [Tulasnella sp. JGI-2019a]|nr:hypothetical protein FRB93_010825 [Tulasnella sp. JGI-2019a]KAG9011434.1 hypothetical protein FRB94_008505 [Tulasnella sp. JGI-2019a]
MVGWMIIAIYCLTLCRVAVDYQVLYRMLFVDGGDPRVLEPTDYVLRGLQQGFSFASALLSDSLFCWRLYVIWSKNIRIIILPACLLALNAVGFIAITVLDFLTAKQPNDLRFLAAKYPLFLAVQSVVIVYTLYITIAIFCQVWWVGSAVDRLASPGQPRRNRYHAVISALAQSGFMYSATMILTIIGAATSNVRLTATGPLPLKRHSSD